MPHCCPITTRPPKYPGEVAIPTGQAGQTRDGVVLCHRVRTIDLRRVTVFEVGGHAQYVTDRAVRSAVRMSLAHHLGPDIPAARDGAA